ncbi:hypothetical protein SynBMKMC1_01129 [Synechococcus sp. BMK-MC-1]|nr:hypothetical protein SynBMKMC1_01129 [Synechococcus sp. BMK-MC-1]
MFVGCASVSLEAEFIPLSPITIEAMREIPNHELIAKRIPAADGNRRSLIGFAHTFNGYAFLAGEEPSERLSGDWSDLSLSELRCLLFWQVRSDRWSGGLSTDWPSLWSLLAVIRSRVEAGALE